MNVEVEEPLQANDMVHRRPVAGSPPEKKQNSKTEHKTDKTKRERKQRKGGRESE